MSKRVFSWILATFLLTTVSLAQAQQMPKVPRLVMLVSGSPETHKVRIDAFREGLHALGYVDGKNIVIEYRYAYGKTERFAEIAAEAVRSKPDVIFVGGTRFVRAAKQATSTIPIVATGSDLVGDGLVASLARPGGNITGTTSISRDAAEKRLELIHEALPKAGRIAVIWYPQGDELDVKQIEATAKELGVKIQSLPMRDSSEFERVFGAMKRESATALIIVQNVLAAFHRKPLLDLAVKNRLPTICEFSFWTDDGCLMSYGADFLHLYRRSAALVDKVLKGTKPADIPVEQPMKFEFIGNLKTAKQIALTIPPNLLVRADRVIR